VAANIIVLGNKLSKVSPKDSFQKKGGRREGFREERVIHHRRSPVKRGIQCRSHRPRIKEEKESRLFERQVSAEKKCRRGGEGKCFAPTKKRLGLLLRKSHSEGGIKKGWRRPY